MCTVTIASGLPGVLSRMALDGVSHPVHLHYPASGEDVVRALVSVSTPGIDLRLYPHGGAGAIAPGLEVRPLKHRIETYGYRLNEPDGRRLLPDRLAAAGIQGADVGRLQRKGSSGGVRLDDVSVPRPGQSFAFVMDTAPCAGAEELADGVDLLVAESTFSDDDGGLASAVLAPDRRAGRGVGGQRRRRHADPDPLLLAVRRRRHACSRGRRGAVPAALQSSPPRTWTGSPFRNGGSCPRRGRKCCAPLAVRRASEQDMSLTRGGLPWSGLESLNGT